jgi:hypothetical protein
MLLPTRKLMLTIMFLLLVVMGALLYQGWAAQRLLAKVTTAFRQACSLKDAWSAYAFTHDGRYPTGEHSSNEAMRELFRAGFIDDEAIFFVRGSAWCPHPPNGELGNPENGYSGALTAGENHWACTSGLSDQDDPRIPMLMDGFTETVGEWSADPVAKGGVWQGRYAVIITVAGASKFKPEPTEFDAAGRMLDGTGKRKDNPLNLVETIPGAKLLNPL